MNPQFIPIGRVAASWGIRGEVKVEVLTDFPDRFANGETVYVTGKAVTVESSKWRGNMVILKLNSIDSVDEAESIRKRFLEVPFSELRPLPEGEYYRFQLVGLDVWSTDGRFLGKISDIIPTGSNDVYEVSSEASVILIPAIDDVVKSIELDKGCMTVEIIKGLL
ncbi:MAG: ribosome maturation factor RimM [Chloroflexota bacterium]|nr:ribosome maturation factor RimM [Chloroflexota bacterium]